MFVHMCQKLYCFMYLYEYKIRYALNLLRKFQNNLHCRERKKLKECEEFIAIIIAINIEEKFRNLFNFLLK